MKLQRSSFASLAAVLAFLGASSAQSAVIDLGTTYTPAGADYTITAVQGIDAAHPLGQSTFAPHVNQNFEFNGVLGVNYQNNSGGFSQGGLSLYNNGPGGGIQSTGLDVQYNSLVTASSVTITVADFDISNNSSFGPSQKAEPMITLLGAGGAVIGTANPAAILPNLVAAGAGGGKNADTWNVNLGGLLKTIGLPDQSISGYLLSAANFAGATFQGPTTDDPYMLVNAGSGTPPPPNNSVPEPSAFLPLLGVLGMVVVGPKLRRKRELTQA